MRFGPLPLDEAEGAILAHGLRVGGAMLRKGRVLSAGDVETLRRSGVEHVTAAKLEPGDIGEDEAATRVAEAVRGGGAVASAAFTGRVNLFAGHPGVLVLDGARIDRLNRVDEALTLATLPDHSPVAADQMIATVKVIPFAVPSAAVDAVCAVAREGEPPMRVAPFKALRAGLVQTRLPGTKESVLDKTVEVTRSRLEALGSTLGIELRGEHEERVVADLIGRLCGAGCDLLLIAGASAITDRRDVLPAGIERAGGTIEHFGMPVDPGNLLLLARIGGVPVLGLPGCARSPKVNGFDWVLQRLAAGLPVTRMDVTGMGVGGLLAEIPTRPLPRTTGSLGQGSLSTPRAPRIAALVLAAGRSSRMGRNKLTETLDGVPMIARVVDRVLGSRARPVIVVTGHEQQAVSGALAGRPVTLVHNPGFADGLSTSLKAGVEALPADVDGCLVCLGDMPDVDAGVLDRLIAAHAPAEGRSICVPVADGRRGNPVLWDRRHFAAIGQVRGDVGARRLLEVHADEVCEVQVDGPGVLLDLDTPAALAAYRERTSG